MMVARFSENPNEETVWMYAMELGMGVASPASGDVAHKTPLFCLEINNFR